MRPILSIVIAAIVGAALAGGGMLAFWWWKLPNPAPAPALVLPDKVQGKAGRLIKVIPQHALAPITWVMLSTPAGVSDQDYDWAPEADEADLVGPAGSYRIEGLLIYKGAIFRAETLVMATPNPGPGPGPDPVPDAFVQALQTAYAAETDPGKKSLLAGLQAVFQDGVTAAVDASLTTWQALYSKMESSAQARGVAGKLPAVQKVTQAELLRTIPTSPSQPLDDAGRKLAAAEFTKIASALAQVK